MKVSHYIFRRLLKNKKAANFLVSQVSKLLKDSSENDRSSLAAQFSWYFKNEMFVYPSLLNTGYLHIDRSIKILKSKNLGSSKIIYDVGAAGGETCILFANAFPNATIVGFEPIGVTFKRLQSNTSRIANIQIHHTALGSERGSSEINIMSRVTSSSLLPSNEESTFNGQKYFEVVEKEKITIAKLDDFTKAGDQVALIKMDVQGYELEVLKGAESTLAKTHFVLLEMQNHHIYKGAPLYYDLDSFLRARNFELFDLIPSIRENDQVKEFDALYINKSLADK